MERKVKAEAAALEHSAQQVTGDDVISQFLLALPMWSLYEAGVVVAARMRPARTQEQAG